MEKESSKDTKRSEANKCLLREKMSVEKAQTGSGRGMGGGRWGERERDRQREGARENSHLCFGGLSDHLFGGCPSWLPLANPFASSGLELTFGMTQGPPLCVQGASFSQDGFYRQGFWEVDQMHHVWCSSIL